MPVDRQDARLRHRTLSVAGDGLAEVWLSRSARIGLHTKTSNSEGVSYWGRCAEVGCLGAALEHSTRCFLHSSEADRATHVRQALEHGRVLSLQGVEVTEQLWLQVLNDVSSSRVWLQVLNDVSSSRVWLQDTQVHLSCAGAVFPFKIRLEDWRFSGHVSFVGAIIYGGFEVKGSIFDGGLDCSFTDFTNSPAWVKDSKFSGLGARYCHSDQHIAFENCDFVGPVRAEGIVGDFRIERSELRAGLDLSGSAITHLSLTGTVIHEALDIKGLEAQSIRASQLKVMSESSMGPLRSTCCDLTSVSFGRRMQIDLSGENVDLSASWFDAGGSVTVKDATIRLERLILGGPLAITGSGSASVSSIQSADAGKLALSSLDLRRCTFYGAHDLEYLRLEPTVVLPNSPRWWRTSRKCIADEYVWRRVNSRWRGKDWQIREEVPAGRTRSQASAPDFVALTAAQVSGVYRALRKGLEAQSNEPGAADFYYGEMEMRRADSMTSRAERLILWLYWLLSGYGLRALRSLIALIALLAIGFLLIWHWGLAARGGTPGDAFLASAQSLLPGITVSPSLTNWGRWISLGLRVGGPILIALTALAVRNRVRR
jgi:hypothetical protein